MPVTSLAPWLSSSGAAMTEANLFEVARPSTVLALTDLAETDGEIRVADLRLAMALGFTDLHKIRGLVSRHRRALETFGQISSSAGRTGPKGGRPGTTFWLTKKQALYVCTKSETPRATEVTIQMVDVFDEYLAAKQKPVKVRAHRRTKPAPTSEVPLQFAEGSDIARDLRALVMSAVVAVEHGKAPDIGQAMLSCLDTIIARREAPGYRGPVNVLDWNWKRGTARWSAELEDRKNRRQLAGANI
jgi:hypothetical protein